MHRLLERQLKRLGLEAESAPSDEQVWQRLLERVSRSYDEADQDRYLMERSLAISSREMQELYDNLRQSSETRITAERDKLQAVITSVGDGLCTLDQDGALLSINPAGELLLGWQENELIGQPVLDMVQVRDEERAANDVSRALLSDVLSSGQPYRDEDGRFGQKDGTTFPVSYVVNPIIKDGLFSGAVLVFRDISARVQTQEELLRLRRAVEQASDGIAVFDMEGNVQFANPAWAHMHGYNLPDIQNKDMSLFHTPEQLQQEVMPCRQQVLESGSHHCQIGHVKQDKSTFPTMMSNTLLKDKDGELVGFVATARDITKRVRAEQELYQQSLVLQGVARAAEQLLTTPHPAQAIQQALATLGAATGVDRVYVFENHPHPASGELAMSQRFEWCGPSIEPQQDKAELQNVPYEPFWYERLSIGNTVNHLTREFPTLIRQALEQQGILALLAVPITIEDQFWGYIGFDDCHSEHRWTDSEQAILMLAASSIGGVIRRQHMAQMIQRSIERRGRQMQVSTLIAQRIAAAPTLDELFRRVVTLVKEQFGFYHAQIFRYEVVPNAVVMVCGYGEIGQQMLEANYSVELKRGVVGAAAATGRAVIAQDVSQFSDWTPNPFLPDVKSALAVPIKLRDQVSGILAVQSDHANALTTDTQLVLEGLCGQVATAIESTRLRQEMEENLREMNALYRATSREGWQEYRETADLPSGYRFDRTTVQLDDDLWGPEIEQAVRQERLIAGSEGQVAIVPMSARGEILGVLGVQDDPQHPLSPDDLALVEAVSEQVGLALEGARLFQQTQDALDQTQALYESSGRVIRATTMDEVLQALIQSTALQRLDRASIQIFDHPWEDEQPESMTVTATWTREDEGSLAPVGARYLLAQFPATRLFNRDEPVIVPDMAVEERLDENTRALLIQQLGMQSLIICPLMAGEQWIGILAALSGATLDVSADEIRQITSLTDQAAAVVQSQLLFNQTQAALVGTQSLHQAGAELNAARSYADILAVLRRHTVLGQADILASIDLFDRPWVEDDWPDWVIVIVRWPKLSREQADPRYLIRDFSSFFELLRSDEPMVINDAQSDPRLDDNMRTLFIERFGARSILSVPLMVGGQWLGYVNGQYRASTQFSESEIRHLATLTAQAAVAIQSLRQLEDIQARVQREQQLREITARLRTPPNVDGVLRVLAQELGQTLGRRTAVRLKRQEFTHVAVADQKVDRNVPLSRDQAPLDGDHDGGRS